MPGKHDTGNLRRLQPLIHSEKTRFGQKLELLAQTRKSGNAEPVGANKYTHEMTETNQRIRIDKWLWAVRIYKTRTLAMQACKAGHVKVDGHNVKPSRFVHIGESIQARNGTVLRKVKVTGLLEQRVSAKEVVQFVKDLTPPEDLRPKSSGAIPQPVILHKKGAGRPTKRDRRKLEELDWG